MKLSKEKLRQLILQEMKELTNEAVEQASMPDTPEDLDTGTGETPGWYVNLVEAIDMLYRNDLSLEERIKAIEEKLGTDTV